MFPTLITLAVFVATAAQGALADFSIITPALTQCQDAKISWSESNGPYNLIVVSPDDPCGDSYADLGDHNSESMTYKVALPAGLKVELSLQDADGNEAWSGPITVGESDDASCVPKDLLKAVPSSAVSSASASSTHSSSATPATPSSATTLVIPAPEPTTTTVPGSPLPPPKPIGAANAGTDPFGDANGALTMSQINTPFMVISALVAAVVLSL